MWLKRNLHLIVPLISALFLALIAGAAIAHFNLQPYRFVTNTAEAIQRHTTLFGNVPDYLYRTGREPGDAVRDPSVMDDGALTLMSIIGNDRRTNVIVVDRQGETVHDWNLDIFEIWGDFEHMSASSRPKRHPGQTVHGVQVMENGDLVGNFEYIGVFRANACGEVIWKLPRSNHHSLAPTGHGTVWSAARGSKRTEPLSDPSIGTRVIDEVAQEIDLETGAVVREISVAQVLLENGLDAYLRIGTIDNESTDLRGDVLHLNDVEEFPADMEPGAFAPGDLLISLRNIHTVLVVDPETRQIKFRYTGEIIRQHDPDFESGDTIIVYDNRNMLPLDAPGGSRIVRLHSDGRLETVIDGEEAVPFFSTVFGKQQRLETGGLLFNEGRKGRALETDADGKLVWEYLNHVGDGFTSTLTEAQRLPPRQDAAFFAAARAACGG